MKKERKLKKESFMASVVTIMFSQVMIKLIGLVYRVYLTNKEGFGDTGNAIYSSGFQIYALLLTLSSVGVPNAVAKLVSEKIAKGDNKGAHKIFKVSFVLFAGVGLVGTLLLLLGAKFISNTILQIPEAEWTLVALSPSIFFVSISSVIRGYFNGRKDMSSTANSQTFEQIFKTVFTIIIVEIIAIAYGADATVMAAGANLATTLAVFLSFIYIYRYYQNRKYLIGKEIRESQQFEEEDEKGIMKEVLKVSVPMSLSSLVSTINKNLDAITVVRGLKHFLSEAEAKLQYGILNGKVDMLIGLPLSFNIAFATALVPTISGNKVLGEQKEIKKRISFSLLVTMLIGLPCAIGMCVFADPILNLLFPNASSGKEILQISAFSIIFMVLAQTVNGALQGLGKVKVPVTALGIGVLVKLILNLILIPIEQIGILGAAASSIVCHLISFSIGYSVLRKNTELNLGIMRFWVKPIIATIIMSVTSYFLYTKFLLFLPGKICTILAIGIAAIVYGISIVALKVLSEEEIRTIPKGEKILSLLKKMKIY